MRSALLSAAIFVAFLASLTAGQLSSGSREFVWLLANSSIEGIVTGIRARRFTCEDVIMEQLRRIAAYNPKLHAFIRVRTPHAIAEARMKDQGHDQQQPLHCVPVAVKDNIDVKGMPTTSGAAALRKLVAVEDSAIVARIRAAGGIIIGKTNMAEMSDSGTRSESTLGGVCANPWDTRRSCLGSSGGSGAAVAAGLAVFAVGTDTEGSVIGPCTASGLLCLRPTQAGDFVAIKTGVYPAFERQDLVGIMAKSPADYLAAHDAIYGVHYSRSSGSVTKLSGLKIRFLDNFYDSFTLAPGVAYSPDPDLIRLHNRAAQRFASLGANVDRHKRTLQEMGAQFQSIFVATTTKPACSNSCMKKSLDKYFERYAVAGPFRKARDLLSVIQGFPVSYQAKLNFTLKQADADVCGSAACGAYEKARSAITNILTDLLGDADALAVPFAAKLPHLNTEEPGLADQISAALNPYTGWPSVALPIGFSQATGGQPSLPVALVLMSKTSQEELLLGIANAYHARYADVRRPEETPALPPVH